MKNTLKVIKIASKFTSKYAELNPEEEQSAEEYYASIREYYSSMNLEELELNAQKNKRCPFNS